MARKGVHLISINPENYKSNVTPEADAKLEFARIRDDLSAGFSSMANVTVGDICTWGASTQRGMMFEIHDSVLNTSMYVVTGFSETSFSPDMDEYLGGSTTNFNANVKIHGSSFASSSCNSNGLSVLVNTDTTVSRADLEYDNAAAMTYSGGDFTELVTLEPNTLTGLQALKTSHSPYGAAASSSTQVGLGMLASIGYDDVAGVWAFMSNSSASTSQGHWSCWGDVINPSSGSFETALVYLGGSISYRGFLQTNKEVHAKDPGGTWRDYDLAPTSSLNSGNYKVSGGADDGKLNWKAVSAENGTGGAGVLGFVKPEFLVEIGLYNDSMFRYRPIDFPTADKPVVCYFQGLAVWWAEGDPFFPYVPSYNP